MNKQQDNIFHLPVPLDPFSLPLVPRILRRQLLEAEHAAGKSPRSKTQRLTPYDKSPEAEQKQTENSYYLNDRAHWQAGRRATRSNTDQRRFLAESHRGQGRIRYSETVD